VHHATRGAVIAYTLGPITHRIDLVNGDEKRMLAEEQRMLAYTLTVLDFEVCQLNARRYVDRERQQ
jgi:hypothetical protein